MDQQNAIESGKESTLASVIATALKMPGVKVNREDFLRQQFAKWSPEDIERIVQLGPVEAGCDQKTLQQLASGLINNRTLASTAASFATGLPGGLAMAATIPADMVQFYGVALRVAQELAYLYGEKSFWDGDALNMDMVTDQLILYCGVMLGASGAASTVRVMSSALAKQALRKLPQKALTKTFYYPVIKSICKAFGVKMTKSIFAKNVSKAIPVIGGVVSGGITFASMIPMCKRLASTLEEAHFDYTQQEFEADWQDIMDFAAQEKEQEPVEAEGSVTDPVLMDADEVMEKIRKAKDMLDQQILTEEEFAQIKTRLLADMK